MKKTDQQLYDEYVVPIYRQLYREAEPKADFDELVKKKETLREQFFDDYYLDQDRQDEIVEEHLKLAQLSPINEKKVRNEVWLGCAPNGVHPDKRGK